MSTMTKSNTRVTVENGWAVRNHDDGSQTRARLFHDPYHPEPERGPGMWNEGVSLIRERDSYRGITLDEHDGLEHVLEHTSEDRNGNVRVETCKPWDPNKNWQDQVTTLGIDREEFVRRYLRAFHDVQYVSLRHHQNYTDWADIWVIVEGVEEDANVDALADATWEEWDAWAKGEVYVVESQTRTLTDAMCSDPSDPDDGWEDDESIGGYYGDDEARYGLSEALSVDEADVPAPYEVTSY